ncbi:Response regulator [Candidatus Terasakiella magnetica]|uniref:Response regulator n=1 Tax=Candidatus Terasakiella magnetica TaxID=1867952 RepID=A0A1C3RFH4_9PROT|nr:response regulator [Candidatus Terasakiella magnetica]SCA56001.1 Response regulator [Candidatus Terasakiella magnetica]
MAHILVIDDEELARFTIREIVEGYGHTIIEAVNGNQGLEKFRQNDVDLIITDIIMPEKEGIETIIELKREQPDLKVIAISGGGRTRNLDFLKLAGEMGADTILAKPFSSDELMSAVNKCLN